MNSQLKICLILLSAIFPLLPGAYGLGFSFGISDGIDGASESLQVDAGLKSAFSNSIEASPEYYLSAMKASGSRSFGFDKTFDSWDSGEHVRLIAKWSDSDYYDHDSTIEKQTGDGVRVSQLMTVYNGNDILSSAEAWNSWGQSAKVGIKIPEGSLKDYSNYGDAMDGLVTSGQDGIVFKGAKLNVFSEARTKNSLQRSSSTIKSSRDLNIETACTIDKITSNSKSKMRTA